jgi:hypothetical protein
MQLEIVRTDQIRRHKVLKNRRRYKLFLKHDFSFIGKLVGILSSDDRGGKMVIITAYSRKG